MSNHFHEYCQIGKAMAKHFDSVYYVGIETGQYNEIIRMQALEDAGASRQGTDFFTDVREIAAKCVHPADIPAYKEAINAVLCGNAEVHRKCYRARRADGNYVLLSTRGFVLSDADGEPEYFGGIIIPQ